MSRIVLIHGFATGIDYLWRPAFGADAGFSGFAESIAKGETSVFRWDIKEHAGWRSLNPWYSFGIYRRERELAAHSDTHRSLERFLEQEKPEIIVCHSMGCYLLLKYLERHHLPASVHTILFNQADVDARAFTVPASFEEAIRCKRLRLINSFCLWDPTLMLSLLISGLPRAGLRPLAHPLVEDIPHPLTKPWNLHTSAIRDSRFAASVISLKKRV
jgi:alpha-beta hydrolase superfamily lysophospholipase